MKRIIVSTLFVLLLTFITAGQTFAAPMAYIDPNTGGLIAQFLLVALAGLSGVFYFFKHRIVMYFKRLTRQPIEEPAMIEQAAEAAVTEKPEQE